MTARRTAARPARRGGYTLLEILVASAIGLLLMGALYAALDLNMKMTDTGRGLVEESDLSRGVFNRLTIDLSCPLAVPQPKCLAEASGTTTAAADPAAAAPATDAAATGATTTATTAPLPLHSGVFSTDGTALTLFVSKSVPWQTDRRASAAAEGLQEQADVVKVTYYLHSSGRGLCRQERPWVTADGVQPTDSTTADQPDYATQDDDLIAPEVVDFSFEFASGTSYVSAWDGSASGTGGAVQGPPRAIKVHLTLELIDRTGKPVQKAVSHVVPVRAGAGTATATTTTTTETTPTPAGN